MAFGSAGDMNVKVGADIGGFKRGMSQVDRGLSGISRKFSRGLGRAAKIGSLAVIGGLAAVAAGAVKTAVTWESAFAGVRKTIDGTEADFERISGGLRQMSREIPVAATELAKFAEIGGQLGISKKGIISFTRVIAEMGESTNLVGEEGALVMAKFSNIMKTPEKNIRRLGSVIVDLGNNSATTEADIAHFGLRVAASGKQVGLSEAQVLSLAAGFSSVGLEAEAGGTAVSRTLATMATAVKGGGEDLDGFAKVAGMSAQGFKKAFEKDAAGALITFVGGLNGVKEAGGNVFEVLDDLELGDIRVRNALLAAAGAGDLLTDTMKLGSKAWKENTALAEEAGKRFSTTASKLTILKNKFKDSALTLGEKLMPAFNRGIDALSQWKDEIDAIGDTKAKITFTVEKLKGLAVQIKDKIVEGFNAVDWDAVWSKIEGGKEAIKELVADAFNAVAWDAVWEKAFGAMKDAGETLAEVGKSIATNIVVGLKEQDWSKVGKGMAAAVATALVGKKVLSKIPGLGKGLKLGKTGTMTVTAGTVIVKGGVGGKAKKPGFIKNVITKGAPSAVGAGTGAAVAGGGFTVAGGAAAAGAGGVGALALASGLLANPFVLANVIALTGWFEDLEDVAGTALEASMLPGAERSFEGLVASLKSGVIPAAQLNVATGEVTAGYRSLTDALGPAQAKMARYAKRNNDVRKATTAARDATRLIGSEFVGMATKATASTEAASRNTKMLEALKRGAIRGGTAITDYGTKKAAATKITKRAASVIRGFNQNIDETADKTPKATKAVDEHGKKIKELPDNKFTRIGEKGAATVKRVVSDLIGIINKVPTEKNTKFDADTASAMQKAQELARVIAAIPSEKVIVLRGALSGINVGEAGDALGKGFQKAIDDGVEKKTGSSFADYLGKQLSKHTIRGILLGTQDVPAALSEKMGDKLRAGLDAAIASLSPFKDKLGSAFAQLGGDALDAFDAATGNKLDKISKKHERKLDEINKKWDNAAKELRDTGKTIADISIDASLISAGDAALTPAEQALKDLDDVTKTDDLKQNLEDAIKDRDDILHAGGTPDFAKVKDAERAIDDAKLAIKRDGLEKTAELERKARDVQTDEKLAGLDVLRDKEQEAAVKDHEQDRKNLEARRKLRRRHLVKQLEQLGIQLQKEPGKWRKVHKQVKKMFRGEFGPDYKTAGTNLGKAFIKGLEDSFDGVESVAKKLADKIAKYLKPGSGTEKGPMRDLPKWGVGIVETLGGGMQAGALDGPLASLVSKKRAVSMSMSASGSLQGVHRNAIGRVGFPRGGAPVHVEVHGNIIGLPGGADELARQVQDALQRESQRTGVLLSNVQGVQV